MDQHTACWIWTGSLNNYGYGIVTFNSKKVLTHRLFYTHYKGQITEGLTVDHLCRNRACCNPDHLELVTSKENTLRGEGPTAINAKKTQCPYGHDLDGVKLTGGRYCKVCSAYKNYKFNGGNETIEVYTSKYKSR